MQSTDDGCERSASPEKGHSIMSLAELEPGMGPDEVTSRFDELQRKLVPMWESIGRSDLAGPLEEENTIVVAPSLTIDVELTSSAQQAYEERFLFMLFLLRQPLIRLIYITSQPIQS